MTADDAATRDRIVDLARERDELARRLAVVDGQLTYVGTASGRTAAVDTSSGERVWTATEGALNPPLVRKRAEAK